MNQKEIHKHFDEPVYTNIDVLDYNYSNSIDNSIIWASCEKKGDHYLQLGSRTFAYTLSGSNIKDIQKNINEQLDKVQGRVFYRKDIGSFNIDKYSEAGVNIDLGNKIVLMFKIFS